MRIIVDCMSGDNAPAELVNGALSAADTSGVSLTLVGQPEAVQAIVQASGHSLPSDCISIYPSSSIITMQDDPIASVQKRDSSMMVALQLLASGKGDALVSAGNTGALFAGATLIVKRLPGISCAGIGTILPGTRPCLLLDAGAKVTVTDRQLESFSIMGTAYMKAMYGIPHPTVGLLNNGTESCKGTALQQTAFQRFTAHASLNFIGNVEGHAALFGACDVLVTDGFTGNIYLKALEGMGKRILKALQQIYQQNTLTKLSAIPVQHGFRQLKREFDPAERGGAPILGIAKPIIKAHGSSDARAVHNAVMQAIRFTESHVIEELIPLASEKN